MWLREGGAACSSSFVFREYTAWRPRLTSRFFGGAGGTRTPDFRLAKAALSQLSYGPTSGTLLVGDGGLEPPTSVLSGPRSNQLS